MVDVMGPGPDGAACDNWNAALNADDDGQDD
jgi:hypothetical protein